MNNSETKTPQIIFGKYVQDHWTQQENENVRVVVDFFQHLIEHSLFSQVPGMRIISINICPNQIAFHSFDSGSVSAKYI